MLLVPGPSGDGAGTVVPETNGFRLSLVSGDPVPSADQTAKTTIYLTPFVGQMIALYDGSAWAYLSSAEVSLALGTLTSGLPYDVYAYDNAGVLTLELLAWTNGTTRATAIVRQNGVWSKTGALTRRYVGTIYTTSTTTTEDSLLKRFVWNTDNRVRRRQELAQLPGHTYASTTIRYWNNDSTQIVEMVRGLNEEIIEAIAGSTAYYSAGSNPYGQVGIGLDNGTAWVGMHGHHRSDVTSVQTEGCFGFYRNLPGLGYHFLSVVENAGVGTIGWSAGDYTVGFQSSEVR